ncbi:MAG: class I SAM-dependent methyltransferase [Chlorobi bacterium]|nr:class I SAM-dependent methyltransferase [Chlorobiota bacterium]MCI0716890.1 class I SAM-dependent methyltransferase [Chlorobiota bacterium]
MGTSNWQNISYNIEIIRKLNPKTILDVGIGFGRWGILFREFLEIWENEKYEGDWDRVIDGVEIYPGYIKDYHKYFYSNIYIDNALNYLESTNNKYDLINLGDIVEHFTKDEGEKLIELSFRKGRFVLINVPIGKNWDQEGFNENPYEEHQSVWYNNDFTKYKHNKIKSFKDFTLRDFSVVLLSKEKIKFDKRFGKYFYLKNFLKHRIGLKKFVERIENRKK